MKKCRKPPIELANFSNVYKSEMLYTGIYFLYNGSELVYIGQSVDVSSRIKMHIQQGKKMFDSAYFIPFKRTKLDGAEEAFVRMFRPKYNKTEDGKFKTGRGKKNDYGTVKISD